MNSNFVIRHSEAVIFLLLVPFLASAQPQPATQPASPGTFTASGNVAAFYSADLYAKESGYVSQVMADIGDHVKQGQVLAVINNPELQQQLIAAKAMEAARGEMVKAAEATVQQSQTAIEVSRRQLAGLEADLKLTQVTLQRQEELFASKAVTVQQVDEVRAKAQIAGAAVAVGAAKIAGAQAEAHTAEANRLVAAAQVLVASAEIQRLQSLVQYLKIVAPFDGVITRRWVNPGDLVQAATASRTTALFTCQKLDVVRVFCDVPESSIAGIKPGVAADVKLYGGAAVIHGKVTRIATAMDPATRTMRAEIDLENPAESLRPGMYAQVTLAPKE